MISRDNKTTIGQAEKIVLRDIEGIRVHARIDTGARTSSIWATAKKDSEGRLLVVFFGPSFKNYTGKVFEFGEFEETVVASSSGHMEPRFKIKLGISIGGKKVRASFTLANREAQVYPVLIGRNVLRGKFIVDVKKGDRLIKAENDRSRELKLLIDRR